MTITLVDQHNHNNHSNCGKGGQNRLESPNWSVGTCSNKSDTEGLVCTGTLVSAVEKSLFFGALYLYIQPYSTNGTQSLLLTCKMWGILSFSKTANILSSLHRIATIVLQIFQVIHSYTLDKPLDKHTDNSKDL